MSKTFDVEVVQKKASDLREKIIGKRFQHYKGGFYIVSSISVDSNDGHIRVNYISELFKYEWSHALDNFTLVYGELSRFKEVTPSSEDTSK